MGRLGGGGGSSLYSPLSRFSLLGPIVENLGTTEVTCYLSPAPTEVRDLYYLHSPESV